MGHGRTGDGGGSEGRCGVSTAATERKSMNRISNSAYNIRKCKRVWTVVRKGSSHKTNEQTDVSKIIGKNVIIVEITMRV
jgi:hypothetical protein